MRYRAFGKLMALALANHCKLTFTCLGVKSSHCHRLIDFDQKAQCSRLPLLFFEILLTAREVRPEDLKGFDDQLHSSLRTFTGLTNIV